jgi:hypothetical protein
VKWKIAKRLLHHPALDFRSHHLVIFQNKMDKEAKRTSLVGEGANHRERTLYWILGKFFQVSNTLPASRSIKQKRVDAENIGSLHHSIDLDTEGSDCDIEDGEAAGEGGEGDGDDGGDTGAGGEDDEDDNGSDAANGRTTLARPPELVRRRFWVPRKPPLRLQAPPPRKPPPPPPRKPPPPLPRKPPPPLPPPPKQEAATAKKA